MKEINYNFFDYYRENIEYNNTLNNYDVRKIAFCVTTNGIVKDNGRAVMGKGIAKEVRDNIKHIDISLGESIKQRGNIVNLIYENGYNYIFSFPTKNEYWKNSNIEMIKKSCHEIFQWDIFYRFYNIIIPRPGCGNGQLNWSHVKKEIEPILSNDKFIIIVKPCPVGKV